MANSIKLDLIDDSLEVRSGENISIRTEDCTAEIVMSYEQLELIHDVVREYCGEKTVDQFEDEVLSLKNKIQELEEAISSYEYKEEHRRDKLYEPF